MDNDRAFVGKLRDQGAHPLAAIVVLTLTVVVGIGLITNEGDAETPAPSSVVSPVALPVASSTAAPRTTPRPRIAVASTPSLSRLAGLLGLPPEGAQPSTPEAGELVDSYWVAGGGVPYRGMARLYADGRLIWNRYYQAPDDEFDWYSTGYIEQRLTPTGVELVRTREYLGAKDPLRLPEWLSPGAWEDQKIRPYVPSGYGVCINMRDARGNWKGDRPSPGIDALLNVLPVSVSTLLRDHQSMSAPDSNLECVWQTVEDAHVLDRVLREAGSEQDEFVNRFMLQHSLDIPGTSGIEIWLMFEPRFPDGSIGCSACG